MSLICSYNNRLYYASGFTLPLVLTVLTGLVFMATGVLQVVSSSRRVHLSHYEQYELSLALESAQEEALSMLIEATNRDQFITHMQESTSELPCYYVSWFDGSHWVHQPLQSGSKSERVLPKLGTRDGYYGPTNKISQALAEAVQIVKEAGGTSYFSAPRISSGEYSSYGFWIEGVNGLLDFEAMTYKGETTEESMERFLSDEEHDRRAADRMLDQRHLGFNLFSSSAQGQQEYLANFEDPLGSRLPNPSAYFPQPLPNPLAPLIPLPTYVFNSPKSLTKALASDYAELHSYLTKGLPDSFELELVPYGYDYTNADGRTQKADLNQLVEAADLDAISGRIASLPGFQEGFTGRRGALHKSESYVNTLAANILDYADLDSQSTASERPLDPDLAPDFSLYRGIDAMPLFSESARSYHILGSTQDEQNQLYTILEVRTFIEIWNPTNQTIRGFIRFDFTPNSQHSFTANGETYKFGSEELYYWGGLVELKPNAYRVLEVTQDLPGEGEAYVGEPYPAGSTKYAIPTTTPLAYIQRNDSRSYTSTCRLYWDGRTSSDTEPPKSRSDFRPVCGLDTGFRIPRAGIYNRVTEMNFTGSAAPTYDGMAGDLRNNLYSRKSRHGSLNYKRGSTFGGANEIYGFRLEKESTFPDGNYNDPIYGISVGGSGSRTRYIPGELGYVDYFLSPKSTPTSLGRTYPNWTEDAAQRAVQKISNRGYYVSLGELGHLYDPSQWFGARRPTQASNQTHYRPLDYSEYSADNNLGGGGRTLAIGSPEFNLYDSTLTPEKKGQESARLLDQFRTTSSAQRSLKARININTAPRKVLEVIFAGFQHTSDPIVGSFIHQAKAKDQPQIASAYSAAIEAQRRIQPYLSTSSIALTRTSITLNGVPESLALFGEKACYEETQASHLDSEVWNDTGREELFRRTYDLFTNKSRSYRIHLQAEYLKGRKKHLSKRTLLVSILPQYDSDGYVLLDQEPQVFITTRSKP